MEESAMSVQVEETGGEYEASILELNVRSE